MWTVGAWGLIMCVMRLTPVAKKGPFSSCKGRLGPETAEKYCSPSISQSALIDSRTPAKDPNRFLISHHLMACYKTKCHFGYRNIDPIQFFISASFSALNTRLHLEVYTLKEKLLRETTRTTTCYQKQIKSPEAPISDKYFFVPFVS